MKRVAVLFMGFTIITFISSLFGTVRSGHAQSSQTWSDPINISNSGSSINPSLVVDSLGTIHAVWVDEIDGYKYAASTDGIEWTAPTTTKFPFAVGMETQPSFLVDGKGGIYILWRDDSGSLNYFRWFYDS